MGTLSLGQGQSQRGGNGHYHHAALLGNNGPGRGCWWGVDGKQQSSNVFLLQGGNMAMPCPQQSLISFALEGW